jgi:integrase
LAKFSPEGQKEKPRRKDRFIPLPEDLVQKIRVRMEERNAQSHDLVFPNGNGKANGHFLRELKSIAENAGVEDAQLHRFRKTYADTLH